MEIVGTKDAFSLMLEQRGIHRILEVDTSTVANWKRYSREGKQISTDKMEEMLFKYGATIKKEKVWEMDTRPMTFYCEDTGDGWFFHKKIDKVIAFSFHHSSSWYATYNDLKSRVKFKIYNLDQLDYVDNLQIIRDEFLVIVNSHLLPSYKNDPDYRVTYRISIDAENRKIYSKAIEYSDFEAEYLPEGDIKGISIDF